MAILPVAEGFHCCPGTNSRVVVAADDVHGVSCPNDCACDGILTPLVDPICTCGCPCDGSPSALGSSLQLFRPGGVCRSAEFERTPGDADGCCNGVDGALRLSSLLRAAAGLHSLACVESRPKLSVKSSICVFAAVPPEMVRPWDAEAIHTRTHAHTHKHTNATNQSVWV